jgi:Uma2 family endonuclease
MMMAMLRLPRATYADYLAVERDSPVRHEFVDGVIIAMAGGSSLHSRLAGRFAGVLTAFASPNCFYHTSDQRFWIEPTGHGRYSDGSLLCGDPEHPEHDKDAAINPVIIVEVVSPSSAQQDHGDKRQDYQSFASLQAYVVVEQDQRAIKVYRRDGRGAWQREPMTYRDGDSFELPRLGQPIRVNQIYDGLVGPDGRSLVP